MSAASSGSRSRMNMTIASTGLLPPTCRLHGRSSRVMPAPSEPEYAAGRCGNETSIRRDFVQVVNDRALSQRPVSGRGRR